MTLHEVAAELARRMDCQVEPGDDPYKVMLQGKGYRVTVAPFFGGWQATLHLPEKNQTWYGEAVDALELRLKARLTGREYE